MLRYIIWALITYSLFRFVFNFIIPVVRASKKMKQQVSEFQERMNGNGQFNPASAQPQSKQRPSDPRSSSPSKSEDYIEFEEIK